MSKKRRNILVIGYWTSSWPSVHMWAFISSSSISVRDMLCSSCCLLSPLMSAVSLCVSICFQWGRWEEGEVDGIRGREREGEGGRKDRRKEGREKGRWIYGLPKDTAVFETSGASVLLARLGGHRIVEAAKDMVECDCRGLLERTFAMRRVRGEHTMGRWEYGENMSCGKTKVGEREFTSIGKRNTFDAHQHGVSLPGLYITYIRILNTNNIMDFWRGEDKTWEGKRRCIMLQIIMTAYSIKRNRGSLCW